MAIRTLMMLQGAGLKGMLRMMRENNMVTASVMVSGIPEGRDEYSVYLFYDEENFEKLGVLLKGELQHTLPLKGAVRAAGVIRGQDAASLIMTGETGDFDWDRAKSIFYIKNQPMPKPVEKTEPRPQKETMNTPEIKPLKEPMNSLDRVYEEIVAAPDLHITPDFLYEEPGYEQPKNEYTGNEIRPEVMAAEEEEEMLQRARFAFEQAHQEACDQCPLHAKKSIIQPFARQYPDYEWEKTEFPGLKGYWHYITGRQYINGTLNKIAIGVPGDYAMNPPSWLYGFNTYAFADGGEAKGYWLLFEDA